MIFVVKVFASALIIAGASELAKRYSLISALLLALPFTSLLALGWTYWETRDVSKVAQLSWGVFWLVPPSLVFFPALSLSLGKGWSFAWSFGIAVLAALVTYLIYAKVLGYFGITV